MEKINSSEQLVQVITESGVEATTAKTLQDSFLPFFNQAQDWAEKASKLVVTSADQVQEMKNARAARLALKEIRVNADKARKLLKEDSLRYGRAVQGVYNVIEYLIVPIEQHLEKQENFVKIQEAEQKAKLKLQREDELRPYSQYVPFGIDLSEMTTENYQIILNGAKLQFEAAIEAKQRAEKERVERENAVKLHNERKNTIILFWSYLTDSQKALDFSTISENEFSMILENCKSQKAEYDKKQAEIKAENERLEAKLETERKEREAALKIERDKQAQLERELQSKKDAEAKAQVEKERAERAEKIAQRKAAKAPDKDKMNLAIENLVLGFNDLKDEEAKITAQNILRKFNDFVEFAKSEIEKL